jgi:N-methylhydantoinase A
MNAPSRKFPNRFLAGIDIGGTFTDLIVYDRVSGTVSAVKVPSNRESPDAAVMAALDKAGIDANALEIVVHGTTVVTNALLERRGAKTAFVTTDGLRDVIELGRTTRLVPNTLYDPYFERPAPLVKRRHRVGVKERVTASGEVETALEEAELEAVARALKAEGIEAVSIGFINSYRNAENERAARDVLLRHFEHVTVSTEVLNEVREFERFSVAVINGYVMPLMAGYSRRLTNSVKERNAATGFYTVASHGGLLSTPAVMAQPVRTVLSGPAAGVAATVHLARATGRANIITYDMGGTSTDVALVHDAQFPQKRETILDGLIIKLPQLDIHTVGAGGGSIAAIDEGGSLQLGPESAGSTPGPACYGRGGERPTITDANVVLGRLGANQELGKSLQIDRDKALLAMERISGPAGVDLIAAAEAVLALAVARMAAAVREISIMRGFDPREFQLLSYGGAGPLHAALVAEEAGISEVVIPPNPGAFSAFGTLCAALRKDRASTILRILDDEVLATTETEYAAMADSLKEEFAAEGGDLSSLSFERQFDMRYRGQSHELTIVVPEDASAAEAAELFETAFEREYGRRDRNRSIELVNVRLVATIPMPIPSLVLPPDGDGTASGSRKLFIAGQPVDALVWDRASFTGDTVVEGPAIIEEMSSTTYIPPNWRARRGEVGELLLEHV